MNAKASSLTVLQTGPLSILVDGGRVGQSRRGITQGGPMDTESFWGANYLCSNHPGDCCIESTLGGLKLKVSASTQIALTGKNVELVINGLQAPVWELASVSAGDEIEIVQHLAGVRSYLAVRGGFVLHEVFGSSTTVVRDRLGGLSGDGKPLADGDVLSYPNQPGTEARSIKKRTRPCEEVASIRFVPGFQFDDFVPHAQRRFINNDYCLTPDMDRMAMRLSGPSIAVPYRQMTSEGICLGAIQIPPDGQPIVMLNDRQTIGGYPKLGSVISEDCCKLAQMRPGSKIRFTTIDMHSAHNLKHLHSIRCSQGIFNVD